jgi:hypothetical protein
VVAGTAGRSATITRSSDGAGSAKTEGGAIASTPSVNIGSAIAPAVAVIASAPVSTRLKVGLMILPPLAEKLV